MTRRLLVFVLLRDVCATYAITRVYDSSLFSSIISVNSIVDNPVESWLVSLAF